MNTLNYKSVTSRVLAALAAGLLVFMAPLSVSEVQAETSQPNEIWFNVNVKGENYAVLDFAFAPGSHTGLKPATICQTIQRGADKNKGTTTHNAKVVTWVSKRNGREVCEAKVEGAFQNGAGPAALTQFGGFNMSTDKDHRVKVSIPRYIAISNQLIVSHVTVKYDGKIISYKNADVNGSTAVPKKGATSFEVVGTVPSLALQHVVRWVLGIASCLILAGILWLGGVRIYKRVKESLATKAAIAAGQIPDPQGQTVSLSEIAPISESEVPAAGIPGVPLIHTPDADNNAAMAATYAAAAEQGVYESDGYESYVEGGVYDSGAGDEDYADAGYEDYTEPAYEQAPTAGEETIEDGYHPNGLYYQDGVAYYPGEDGYYYKLEGSGFEDMFR